MKFNPKFNDKELRDFYDERWQQRIDGDLGRIKEFHRADNISFNRDLRQVSKVNSGYLLDVGCGWAIHGDIVLATSDINPVKLDISFVAIANVKKRMISYGEKQTQYVNSNVEMLPFKDSTFRLVICSQVLEHVRNDKIAMSELYRVLKKGGVLILAVPNNIRSMSTLYHSLQKQFDEAGHLREYNEADVISLAIETGFKVKRVSYHCFLFFWLFAWSERNVTMCKLWNSTIARSRTLSNLIQVIMCELLYWENILLGNRSSKGMSIKYVLEK
jgi:2-polyprenyl-3-methyl-5-hydroxy-6-metoxy-1,4-benzoquinol methylase